MIYTSVILASFLSGVSCLIYELVWSRYLTMIFGVSVYAVATVLACFMLGLALGSWHLGRMIDRSRRAIHTLLWLEAGIGIYIALSPLLYHGFLQITIHLFQTIQPEGYLRHGIRFVLALLALVIPTYLMGGTFPAVLKIISQQPDRVGHDVGIVYAANTLGGAVGAMLGGFLLIKAIGLAHTLFLASSVNFAVAAMMALILRESGGGQEALAPSQSKAVQTVAGHPGYSAKLVCLALAIFGLSGFTSLAYEVCWTRILTFFFRDSIYDFTIVLTTFLIGIAVGSLLGSRWIGDGKSVGIWFALVEILIGLFSLVGLFLISRFPYLINHLQTNTVLANRFGANYWMVATIIRFGYAFLLMIIPTCLFGATFPLVGRMCAGNTQTLGRRIGLMNGVNTVGAALGSITPGFVLISVCGIQQSIILTALLNIGSGLILLAAIPLAHPRAKPFVAMASAAMATAMMVLLPGWDRLRMSTSFLDQNQPLEELLSLEFYKEDASGVTSVVELKPLQRKYLISNRLYGQNTSDLMVLEDHRRLGHIPMLLHPHPRSALAVGLGAGITLRGMSDHDVEAIDCVEISPGVIEAARCFGSENRHITENPRVHLIVDDGRSYISTTRKKYDAIVLDILFPMSTGSSTAFSREYFELCKQRLQPGGLVCQWLPVHQLSLEEIKIIVGTFREVFPHTSLWYGMIGESTAVVGCIGTDKELAIDFERLLQEYRNASLAEELREINLNNPILFLSHFIMADDGVLEFCRGQPVNTDDRPLIEFSAPKLAMQSSRQARLNLLDLSRRVEDISPHVINTGKPISSNFTFEGQLKRYTTAKRTIIEGYRLALANDSEGQFGMYQEALAKDPTNEDLLACIREWDKP